MSVRRHRADCCLLNSYHRKHVDRQQEQEMRTRRKRLRVSLTETGLTLDKSLYKNLNIAKRFKWRLMAIFSNSRHCGFSSSCSVLYQIRVKLLWVVSIKSTFSLTFYSLLVTWCTTSLTFNNFTLCPHCIYVFCVSLRTNSDLCHLQHKLIGFYNRDASVYCAVRIRSLNKAVCRSSLKGSAIHLEKYLIIFNNSARTSKESSYVSLIYINR